MGYLENKHSPLPTTPLWARVEGNKSTQQCNPHHYTRCSVLYSCSLCTTELLHNKCCRVSNTIALYTTGVVHNTWGSVLHCIAGVVHNTGAVSYTNTSLPTYRSSDSVEGMSSSTVQDIGSLLETIPSNAQRNKDA